MNRGIRQGNTISPKLFTLTIEDMFKKQENFVINLDGDKLSNLRYADNVVLIVKGNVK